LLENVLHHACADAELPADLEDAVSARPEFENSQIVVTFTTTTLVAAVAPTVTAVALVCSVSQIVTAVARPSSRSACSPSRSSQSQKKPSVSR
jgi:hypothetical protein